MVDTPEFDPVGDRQSFQRQSVTADRGTHDLGSSEARELPVLGVTICLVDPFAANSIDVYPENRLKPEDIREGGRYYFKVLAGDSEPPPEWEVRVGTLQMERHLISGHSYFFMNLGFYSGVLSFKVMSGVRVVVNVHVTVSPPIAKLTTHQYSAMLEDLTGWTRALYRTVGATVPADTAAGESNRLVTLNLIGSYIDLLEAAVHRIADRPVVRFSSTDRQVDFFRVKEVSAIALRKALRSPRTRLATRAEAAAAPKIVAALGGHVVDKINLRRGVRHSSIYEHRALLGFLNWLDGVCQRLTISLSSENPKKKNLVSADVALWRKKIEKMRRRDVFANIPPDPSLRPSNIFTMKPSYKSAFNIAMKLRHGLGPNGFQVSLPLAETPLLYEMWCLAGLLIAVAQNYPISRSEIARGLKGLPAGDGFGWTLPRNDNWSIPLENDIVLNYQLNVGPRHGLYGLRTLVVGATPDVSIIALGNDGNARSMVILDPKYRTGQSLQDGIRSLHFYRDAILDAEGRPVVIGAVALHPDVTFSLAGLLLASDRPTSALLRPGIKADFENVVLASVSLLRESSPRLTGHPYTS